MKWHKHAKRRTRIPRNFLSAADRINTNFSTRSVTYTPHRLPTAPICKATSPNEPKPIFSSLALSSTVPHTDTQLPTNAAKCCAIVGNAKSIFEKEQGNYIDTFDFVVRINTIRIRSAASQGKRTSLLFAHGGVIETIPRRVYKSIEVINTSTDLAKINAVWAERIKRELDDQARLSTGFLSIIAMMQLNYHITLFGFDWYATPTYYTNRGPWRNHHPDWEKKIILPLLEEHNARICNQPTEPQVLPASS